MNIGGILLCRMDSERLPGKVLEQVGSMPLLELLVRRIRTVPLLQDKLILATTDRKVDQPLADFAQSHQLKLFRGSVHNVAHRVLKCAEEFQLDAFLRINGDSPWLDPQLLQEGIAAMQEGRWQLVTNLRPRSFPYGISLEAIRTDYFAQAYQQMSLPGHFENVTKSLYGNIREGEYLNVARQGLPEGDVTRVRMTVDTAEDLQLLREVVHQQDALQRHDRPLGVVLQHLDWRTVLPFYQQAAEIRRTA